MSSINNGTFENHIKEVSNIIKNELNILNDKYIQRDRKINITDLFHFLCHKNGNNNSYNSTNYHFTKSGHFNVSNTAIIKKRKLIKANEFDSINYELLSYIYKDVDIRFLAVDGSQMNLLKQIIEEDDKKFSLSKSKKFKKGLLSSIIDIDREIVINCSIFNHENERKALEEQLKYIRKGDVLIFDRGYYSKELLELLLKKGIGFIFRMIEKNNYCKLLSTTNDLTTEIKIKKTKYPLRIIKYTLESSKQRVKIYKKDVIDYEQYYLLTSLIDEEYTLDRFKELYHKRWKVETNFRYLKYYASLGRINTKTMKFVEQDVSIHNFIFILTGFFEHLLIEYAKIKNKKINTKLMLKLITEDIMIYLVKGEMDAPKLNKIMCLFKILLKFLVPIQKDRHYKRQTKIPMNEWAHIWAFFK
jgi:hypothetical protein